MALIKWYYIVFVGAEARGTVLDEMVFEFCTSSFSPTCGINVPCNRQINTQRRALVDVKCAFKDAQAGRMVR